MSSKPNSLNLRRSGRDLILLSIAATLIGLIQTDHILQQYVVIILFPFMLFAVWFSGLIESIIAVTFVLGYIAYVTYPQIRTSFGFDLFIYIEALTALVGYVGALLVYQQRESRALADRRSEQIQLLRDITEAAFKQQTLQQILAVVLRRCRQLLGTDNAAFLILDDTGSRLIIYAADGPKSEYELVESVPVGKGFTGLIASTKKPWVVSNVHRLDLPNPKLLTWAKSVAGVPVMSDGELLGVLQVGTREYRRFTDEDVELLTLVADRIASRIQHKQKSDLLVRSLRAELRERQEERVRSGSTREDTSG